MQNFPNEDFFLNGTRRDQSPAVECDGPWFNRSELRSLQTPFMIQF